MSTKYERSRPITSTERQRKSNAAHATPAATLHAQEIHTTSDQSRIFRNHIHVGGTVDHGTVADSAAMAALGGTSYTPGTAARGVWAGDTCWRADEDVEYQCIAGSDDTAEWRAVGVGATELAAALARPSHEVMFWVMGLRKYGWLAEIKEVTDEGYFRYQVVEREGS